MLLLIASALAATVAVLPLEEGAGGEAFAGLGKALAGMLTTDLSTAPGITLVERARLDALLAEIELKDTGFLDEATAQRLGKGLGAEFVVVGSYSVVGETFLLDARLVGVETARVVRAANAHGSLAGFVDVEKTLVTGLLDGLSVTLAEDARQRLLAAAPTRDFSAFAAYGEGIALRDEGKLEAARAAFGEAIGADPGFRDAATALGGLRLELDRMAAERLHGEQAARAQLLDRVIATFPEPKAGDKKAVPGFALRLLALHESGRHCQRYEEQRRYLETTDWRFALDTKGYHRLVADTMKAAEQVGYAPSEKAEPQRYRDVQFRVQTDAAMLLTSPSRLLYAFPTALLSVPSSQDLLATMARCLSVPEQITALGELSAAATAHGAAGATDVTYAVPLTERLEWTAIAIRARTGGVDAALSARIQALVAAHEGDTRVFLEGEARQVVQMGEVFERARVRRLGFREGQVASALDGLGKKDPTRFAVDAPHCAALLPTYAPQAARLAKGNPAHLTDWVAPFRDLGCLVGQPARFADPAAAFEYVMTAPLRARPENAATCAQAFATLPERGAPSTKDAPAAWSVLNWYYASLVFPLCVTYE